MELNSEFRIGSMSEAAIKEAAANLAWTEVDGPAADADQHAVVFDAGSSGSRVYIFKWPSTGSSSQLPLKEAKPVELYSFSDSTGKGVQLADGRKIVKELLEGLKTKQLAGKDISKIPVFLFATAGLRIISDADRAVAVNELRSMFKASGFMFADETWARMISGEEEAIFDWMAVQILKNGGSFPSSAKAQYYGALDMGGASTQIAFKPSVDPVAGSYSMTYGGTGVNLNIYLHSYLYAGANEWRERINNVVALTYAEKASTINIKLDDRRPLTLIGKNDVPHPCYLSGYTFKAKVDALGGAEVTFKGTGNAIACRLVTRQLMNLNDHCLTDPKPIGKEGEVTKIKKRLTRYGFAQEPPRFPKANQVVKSPTCAMDGTYQPSIPKDAKFIAFSAYSFLYDYVETLFGTPRNAPLSVVGAAIDKLCSMPWADFAAKFPKTPEKFMRDTCLNGVYFNSLMVEAYGIPADVQGIVTVAKPSEGFSWTAGAVAYYANLLGLVQPASHAAAGNHASSTMRLAETLVHQASTLLRSQASAASRDY